MWQSLRLDRTDVVQCQTLLLAPAQHGRYLPLSKDTTANLACLARHHPLSCLSLHQACRHAGRHIDTQQGELTSRDCYHFFCDSQLGTSLFHIEANRATAAAATTAALMRRDPQTASWCQRDACSQRQRLLLPGCQPEDATLVEPAGQEKEQVDGRCWECCCARRRALAAGSWATSQPGSGRQGGCLHSAALPDECHLHLLKRKLPACKASPGRPSGGSASQGFALQALLSGSHHAQL